MKSAVAISSNQVNSADNDNSKKTVAYLTDDDRENLKHACYLSDYDSKDYDNNNKTISILKGLPVYFLKPLIELVISLNKKEIAETTKTNNEKLSDFKKTIKKDTNKNVIETDKFLQYYLKVHHADFSVVMNMMIASITTRQPKAKYFDDEWMTSEHARNYAIEQLTRKDFRRLFKLLETFIDENIQYFPNTIFVGIQESELRDYAVSYAKLSTQLITTIDYTKEIITSFLKCSKVEFTNDVVNLYVDSFAKAKRDFAENENSFVIMKNKLLDEKWWLRRLRKMANDERSQWCAILRLAGGNNKKQYCDDYTFEVYQGKQDFAKAYLKKKTLIKKDRDGKVNEYNMWDIKVSSDKSSLCRIYALCKSFEDLAKIDTDLVCSMITITVPSQYHSNPSKGKRSWSYEFTMNKAKKRLNDMFVSLRANAFRYNIQMFGTKVVELHKDMCPHIHFSFYAKWQDISQIDEILKSVCSEWTKDDFNGKKLYYYPKYKAKKHQKECLERKIDELEQKNFAKKERSKRVRTGTKIEMRFNRRIDKLKDRIRKIDKFLIDKRPYSRLEYELDLVRAKTRFRIRAKIEKGRIFKSKDELIAAYAKADKKRIASNMIIINENINNNDKTMKRNKQKHSKAASYLFKYLLKSMNVNPNDIKNIKDDDVSSLAKELITDKDESHKDNHDSGDQVKNFDRHRAATTQNRIRRYSKIGICLSTAIMRAMYVIRENDIKDQSLNIPDIVKNAWNDMHNCATYKTLLDFNAIKNFANSKDNKSRVKLVYEDYINSYGETKKRSIAYAMVNEDKTYEWQLPLSFQENSIVDSKKKKKKSTSTESVNDNEIDCLQAFRENEKSYSSVFDANYSYHKLSKLFDDYESNLADIYAKTVNKIDDNAFVYDDDDEV